ncbi:MAG: hypothetical protein DI537_39465 [Stutzerimonas stutzeri]|nr:MAG: hypothetical protein DI537_39465 [Stutzerimonas stutzeri]
MQPLHLRPKLRQEPLQWGFEPSALLLNGIKAILVGTVEGRFAKCETDQFFPHVNWDWLEANLPEAEKVLDELIMRGFVFEMVWPEFDEGSTFGLTVECETWIVENLDAPEDFDPEDEETLEYLTGLDWIRKSDPRASALPPVGRGTILASHIHNINGKQIKLTRWVAQATYTHAESHAALALVEAAVERAEITLKAAGQYKRRIKERTLA